MNTITSFNEFECRCTTDPTKQHTNIGNCIEDAVANREEGESYTAVAHRIRHPDAPPLPRRHIHVVHYIEPTQEEAAENDAAAASTAAIYAAERANQWAKECPPGTTYAHIEAHPDPVMRAKLQNVLADYLAGHVKNIRLTGTMGTGKTYAAAALCRSAIEAGRSATWVTMADLDTLSGSRRDYSKLDRIYKARLLVVDDWGSRLHSRAVVELVKDIQDQRPDDGVIVWTTNNPLPTTSDAVWREVSGLPKWFSESEKEDLAEQLDRVYDRMRFELVDIAFGGASLRHDPLRLKAAREAEKAWWESNRPGSAPLHGSM